MDTAPQASHSLRSSASDLRHQVSLTPEMPVGQRKAPPMSPQLTSSLSGISHIFSGSRHGTSSHAPSPRDMVCLPSASCISKHGLLVAATHGPSASICTLLLLLEHNTWLQGDFDGPEQDSEQDENDMSSEEHALRDGTVCPDVRQSMMTAVAPPQDSASLQGVAP